MTKKYALIFSVFSFLRIPMLAVDMIMIARSFFFNLPWAAVIFFALQMSFVALILSIIYIYYDYIVGKKQAKHFKNILKQPGVGICTWIPWSRFYDNLAEDVLKDCNNHR